MKTSSASQWPLAAALLLWVLANANPTSMAAQGYQPAGQFKTEEQAKKYCPNDVVVRVDLATRRFYMKGHFLYAIAGSPTFECRREALQEGNLPG